MAGLLLVMGAAGAVAEELVSVTLSGSPPAEAVSLLIAAPRVTPDIAQSSEGATASPQFASDAFPAAPRVTVTHSHMVSLIPPRTPSSGQVPSSLTGVSYRWWLGEGRGHVGLGVGTLGYAMQMPAGPLANQNLVVGSAPTITLGVRYSMSRDTALYADALTARGLGDEAGAGYYNTQVGLEWKNALSKLGFENGAFGFKLDSGYRMSLRLRRNGVGLYFRSQF